MRRARDFSYYLSYRPINREPVPGEQCFPIAKNFSNDWVDNAGNYWQQCEAPHQGEALDVTGQEIALSLHSGFSPLGETADWR